MILFLVLITPAGPPVTSHTFTILSVSNAYIVVIFNLIRDKASIARAIILEIEHWNVLIFWFFTCSICKATGAMRSLYPHKLAPGLKTKGIGQSWWVLGVGWFGFF